MTLDTTTQNQTEDEEVTISDNNLTEDIQELSEAEVLAEEFRKMARKIVRSANASNDISSMEEEYKKITDNLETAVTKKESDDTIYEIINERKALGRRLESAKKRADLSKLRDELNELIESIQSLEQSL
jgi:uncharacterized coiled-coil DUF342 family protein